MPRFMVIETYREGCLEQVYERFHRKGRMLPPGLDFLESWLEQDGDRCFQLMQAEEPALLLEWAKHWDDLMDLEIIELRPRPERRQEPA